MQYTEPDTETRAESARPQLSALSHNSPRLAIDFSKNFFNFFSIRTLKIIRTIGLSRTNNSTARSAFPPGARVSRYRQALIFLRSVSQSSMVVMEKKLKKFFEKSIANLGELCERAD